jgi:hypothetical protein
MNWVIGLFVVFVASSVFRLLLWLREMQRQQRHYCLFKPRLYELNENDEHIHPFTDPFEHPNNRY